MMTVTPALLRAMLLSLGLVVSEGATPTPEAAVLAYPKRCSVANYVGRTIGIAPDGFVFWGGNRLLTTIGCTDSDRPLHRCVVPTEYGEPIAITALGVVFQRSSSSPTPLPFTVVWCSEERLQRVCSIDGRYGTYEGHGSEQVVFKDRSGVLRSISCRGGTPVVEIELSRRQ
jgi:hypothetical protein